MKIGIITHYLHFGYGGVLQNYALQNVLKQMGHSPITLRVAIEKDNSWIWRWRNHVVRCIHSFQHKDSGITLEQDAFISQKVESFIERYVSTTKPCRTKKDFRDATISEGCDALIIGSDQIWRPNYDYVSNCFLDFAEDLMIRKLSYAVSFGVDNWRFTPEETTKYRKLIKQFDYISVREESGILLCDKYLERKDATLVLDPTLLLEKEDYLKLVIESEEKESEGNLFTYILDKTKEKETIIENIKKTFSMKRYECMPKYSSTFENVKKYQNECIYPPLTQWLKSFVDAEMVVTDSFHGTVFCIIFNKDFYVLLNEERGNARFISLLKLFGLEDRIIDNNSHLELKKNIDWYKVNNKRKELKEKSIAFIKSSLS